MTTLIALATIAFAGLIGTSAFAQTTGAITYASPDGGASYAYFVTGNASIFGDISGPDNVVVGKDIATFNTLPGTSTLSVDPGAVITGSDFSFPGLAGINVYGSWQTTVTGGSVDRIEAWDTSTINVTGGSVNSWIVGDGTNLVNISGGSVGSLYGVGTGTFNITGGSIGGFPGSTSSINLFGNDLVNISGGTVMNGIDAGTGLVNIYGNNLNFTHAYDDSLSQYDVFTVTGNWADTGNTSFSLDVKIANTSGIGNPTQRQFNLISSIPEPGTGVLALLGAVTTTGLLIRRRRS